MNVIELQAFGDFDMRYTDSVWVGEGDAKAVRIEAEAAAADNHRRHKREAAYRVLKQHGFKRVDPTTILIGE